MKEELAFDYPLWRASQPTKTFKVVSKDERADEYIEAHEPVVGDPTPTLRLVKYSVTEVTVEKETGGSKNKKVETIVKEEAVADMVAAYHAGEWAYFVDTDKSTRAEGSSETSSDS